MKYAELVIKHIDNDAVKEECLFTMYDIDQRKISRPYYFVNQFYIDAYWLHIELPDCFCLTCMWGG